ncbi:MAG: CbiX/SirB N-terminal domain-containing protein, partial [Methanobrevibacter sp.]|nr:CbiX/SirB N-terminal domain-containing protein [Methanobrevibacter sp.]
ILSHGSRLRYNKEFLMALFEQYENQAKYPSNYGFMELSEPNIPDSANLLIKRDNLERLVVIPVFIAPGMHTKIDIKAILNLIHENEKNNRSKPKNNNIKEIKINKIILEEDPDHAHKYDETVDFEGEILYPDPIGADDILIEILEDMVKKVL